MSKLLLTSQGDIPDIMQSLPRSLVFLLIYISAGVLAIGCLKSTKPGLPKPVQNALNQAGLNQPSLLEAILQYENDEDSTKKQALYFIIEQIPEQYAVFVSFTDNTGVPIIYNPQKFANDNEIKNYLDSLALITGPLRYQADSFKMDLQHISYNILVKTVDLSFEAWQKNPWSQQYTFDEFCYFILPYRAANEPLIDFRPHFISLFRDSIKEFKDPEAVASKLNQIINKTIIPDDRLHRNPNQQHFGELERTRTGSSLDLALYKTYALRSLGIGAAIIYCPYYSDSTGGVYLASAILPGGELKLLDNGTGINPLRARKTPKIFQRSFARVPESLYSIKSKSDFTPPFLGHFQYIDITSEFFTTRDTVLQIKDENKEKYYYLAVYNDSEWKAIDWAQPDSMGYLTFNKLGIGQRYSLAKMSNNEIITLALPFTIK